MSYVKLADILHPVKVGTAEVDIMDFSNGKLGFREIMDGLQPEKYARLRIDGETMMSETPMEHITNRYFVCHAHGDVLIGGLGLGMIILAIQDKPEVQSITVLEKSKDVIDAVLPQLPVNDKVTVIEADAFLYRPEKKYDCIYMDIWPYMDEDLHKEVKALKRRYGHYLKPVSESPNRFNKCWAESCSRI